MAELTTWLSLVHTRGLGPALLRKLLAGFGSVDAISSASNSKLAEVGLASKVIDAMNNVDDKLVQNDLNWAAEGDDRAIITLDSPLYPPLLKEIADPPIVLYVRGDPEVLQTPQLAIVGSRKPSRTAENNALRISSELAGYGITVTSGLAQGVDAFAHQGALQADGLTIAVTATGLDRVYPASHQSLAHEIAVNGAIVSEFPIGTNPLRAYFPRRNRIISGLTYGTLVVEAALKSGTLTTAAHATEQSREVFAIPGNIDNPQARGSHALLKAGATLVETSADILQQLAAVLPNTLTIVEGQSTEGRNSHGAADQVAAASPGSTGNKTAPQAGSAKPSSQAAPPSATPDSDTDARMAAILKAVEYAPLSLDEIIETTGFDVITVTNLTLEMELSGSIESVAGGMFQKSAIAK